MAINSYRNEKGQILIEALSLTFILASLLVYLGVFFTKSENAFKKNQFMEVSHERKNKNSSTR